MTEAPPLPDSLNTAWRPEPIGPLWFVPIVCALLLGRSLLSTWQMSRISSFPSHTVIYLTQIAGVWTLLGAVVATVYRRRAFFHDTLERGARSWFVEVCRGTAVLAIFIIFTGIVHLVFRLWMQEDASGLFGAASRGIVHIDRSLGVGRVNVDRIAPSRATDLILWTVVSFTAGFCEEHIFRGYLLRQLIALLAMLRWSPQAVRWTSVLLTAILFASLHIYEGTLAVFAILGLGMLYGAAALRFGNLRALIVAHFLQDLISGLLTVAKHS